MKTLMLTLMVVMSSCAVTSHGTQPSKLGTAKSSSDLVASLDKY